MEKYAPENQAKNSQATYRKPSEVADEQSVVFVVKGIPVNVSESHIVEFLGQKGIVFTECKLMTSHDHARTLTFQLKVGKADYDKVSAPDLWSPDILIEPYRKKKRRNSRSKHRVPKQNGELPENRKNGMKSHIAMTYEISTIKTMMAEVFGLESQACPSDSCQIVRII